MLEIKGNEERIDETIETITMSKGMFMHLNFVNAARQYTADSFIKCRTPIDVAYTIRVLKEETQWGEDRLMEFIELFNVPRRELSFDADDYEEYEYWEEERNRDCNGIGNECIERFNDFCAAFKMTWMTGIGGIGIATVIEFVNQQRDILIDDESSDKEYIGKFTVANAEGRWFSEIPTAWIADIPKGEEE